MTTTFRNALDIGNRVDRYRIEAIIGHGGFGISYRAIDLESGVRIALKEFLPSELATREADASVYALSESHLDTFHWGLERFLDEARLLARFRHPNIVRVHCAFEGHGTAYMVMSYEEGESLAARLKREGTLASEALTAMTLPLLDGLELVHEAGFIHRDIKPGNIHLRDDGSPVLLDFGSARQALKGKTRTLTALVSAGYAPLEQYFSRSDLQGPWTDIYALGATLYHAISGEPPIDAVERSRGVLGSTRDVLPPVAEVANGDYPPCLLAAVDHALRVEDQERPRSVDQWRKELTGETPVPSPAVSRQVTPSSATQTIVAHRHETEREPRQWNRVRPIALPALIILAFGSLGWWHQSFSTDGPDDAIVDAGSVATANLSADGLERLRTSLEKTTSSADSASRQADSLAARIERLEIERVREGIASTNHRSTAAAERARLEQKEALIADLRTNLEKTNVERDAALRQIGELEARLRLLEAVRQAESVEVTSRQQEIDALLAAAAEDIDRLRLTTPEGENAHARYLDVLSLESENPDAIRGLQRIVEKYVELAEQLREDGQLADAESYLKRASEVLPESAFLAVARRRLAEAKRDNRAERQPANIPAATSPGAQSDKPPGGIENPRVAARAANARKTSTDGDEAGSSSRQVVTDESIDPLNVAILRFARRRSSHRSYHEILSRKLTREINGNRGLRLVYSYYSPNHDAPRLHNAEIWTGGPVSFQLNKARAIAIAHRLKADLIVTVQNPITHMGQWGDILEETDYDADIYLLDVKRERVYHRKEKIGIADKTLSQMLRQAGVASRQATIPGEIQVSSTPLRTIIFPTSAGNFSSFTDVVVPDIVTQLTDFVHSNRRLSLTYSFYDEAAPGQVDSPKFWNGIKSLKKPDIPAIVAAARDMDTDIAIALLHWNRGGMTDNVYVSEVTLHMIDVQSQKVYSQSGYGHQIASLASAALDELTESRFASSSVRLKDRVR